MKCALLLSLMLVFLPTCAYPSADNHDTTEQHISSYLKDLEEQGYCVIPHVLSTSETEVLYERVWREFIEKAWPRCKMDDRSTWKKTFPVHNRVGVFSGPAGQIQVMWDLRQDPRIVTLFAQIWNTEDLIVSMDGISIMCPPEIRKGYIDPWPHVDQSSPERSILTNKPPAGFVSESLLSTKPYTIQGQFLFEDSFEGDGGFYCIPTSHLQFNEFAYPLEKLNDLQVSQRVKAEMSNTLIKGLFDTNRDDANNKSYIKHVTAPKGSLILWDSRTIHWNQHARRDRPYQEKPKVRMVGYLCYVPKARLDEEGRMRRVSAFETGISTTHNPANPGVRHSVMLPEFKRYREDPNYIRQKPILTPLGRSLLGID